MKKILKSLWAPLTITLLITASCAVKINGQRSGETLQIEIQPGPWTADQHR